MVFGVAPSHALPAPASAFKRYLLAIALVTAATLIRFAADPWIHDEEPYFLYVAAVVVAAWFAGSDGGILATILSTGIGRYFFLAPRRHVVPAREDWIEIAAFALLCVGLVWLVGRWRSAERLARRLHHQTAVVLEQLPVGVILADDTGRLVFGNPAVEQIFRRQFIASSDPAVTGPYNAFRVRGRPLELEHHPMARALKGERTTRQEVHIVRGDGTSGTLSVSGAPVPGDDGKIAGGVIALNDITEQQRAAEQLEQRELQLREQARALEQANRVKDEFLATLSHELRTPLNAVLGWSDLLLRPGIPPETNRKALESIKRNAEAQAALISDILDVSRIIAGKLRLDPRPVDLWDAVKAACESVQHAADAKGVEIRTRVEGRPVVVGDADRLQQIVWNLVSNSVKFCDRGGRVDVDVRRGSASMQIVVRDNGAGIAPDFLPHAFERFRQADSSLSRRQTGLGLGLALVRSLTELHGGTVTAASEGEGRGAVFTVDLPVPAGFDHAAADGSGAADRRAPAAVLSPDCLAGLRVVAVDDHEEARALVQAVLERYGAHVSICSTAEQVIAAITRERPDVLLADIGMPDMDGYELIRKVRELPGIDPRAMPAVALTAYGGLQDRARALAAGFAEHVAKPITPDALVAAVGGVAGRNVN